MMRFDHFSGFRAALDDIRVDRALCKKIDSLELAGLFLEHTNKFRADNFAFLLRISHTREL